MEHKQPAIDESSSATSVYCSTLEELQPVTSYTSAVEDQSAAEESTSVQHWTSIDHSTESENEDFVRVLPGRKVQKYKKQQIKLLEKIGEGGQGIIHTAQLNTYDIATDEYKPNDNVLVAKVYRGRKCGQWPEEVFALHLSNRYICQFFGYCIDGESFYLLMAKYDCSLRDVLDKQMKENFNGRPLPEMIALYMIIQIAIGMWFLHENKIVHQDLKADNIFVTTSPTGGIPLIAHIGDFDVASNVVGTLFWRAPEVLQALKEGQRPVFTPQADVYSYAMTCYEILTGGIPLEGVKASNYDAVLLSGKRPKLPSNLNPKMKDFMNRCWHQDPEVRPTFKEIVAELKDLHRELVIGSVSKVIDGIFHDARNSLDIVGASPEASLLELKALLQALVVKYNQAEFLLLGLEIVADIEQYQCEFGLQSFKEHPVLPFQEWFAREKLHNRIRWKLKVFEKLRAHIVEMLKIVTLMSTIMVAVYEDYGSNGFAAVQSENQTEILSMSDLKTWVEECHTRVLPDSLHSTCVESPRQACDLCKGESLELVVEEDNSKYCMYVDNGSALTKFTSSVVSSLKAKNWCSVLPKDGSSSGSRWYSRLGVQYKH